MTSWLIVTRAVHFGACLLLFGAFAFDRFTVSVLAARQTEMAGYWLTRLRLFNLVLLPMIAVSGAAWFLFVAMAMSGQPLGWNILKVVWTQTQFGTVWEIRLVLLLIAAVVAALSFFLKWPRLFQKVAAWFQLAVSGCLLGSLAWAGHGVEGPLWHLVADVLHLLAAGVWPGGLLPLFLLLRRAWRLGDRADWLSTAMLVRRFSAISLAAVSLLVASGLVNAWVLVGSFSNLIGQSYGHWLLAKLVFFAAALVIAGVNLLRLKPRLLQESSQPKKAGATAEQLQVNVLFELIFMSAVIVVVAILGILPPANH